jgi:hypothetical protein
LIPNFWKFTARNPQEKDSTEEEEVGIRFYPGRPRMPFPPFRRGNGLAFSLVRRMPSIWHSWRTSTNLLKIKDIIMPRAFGILGILTGKKNANSLAN